MGFLRSGTGIRLAGIVFLGFYGMGFLDADNWWGTHAIAFLSREWSYVCLLTGSLLFLGALLPTDTIYRWIKIPRLNRTSTRLTILLTGITMGFLFYLFPIVHDHYGDAFMFRDKLDNHVTEMPPEMTRALLSWQPEPSYGRNTLLGLINLAAWISGQTYRQVFTGINIICGVAFMILWLWFVSNYLKHTGWKVIMSLTGLTAPFTQHFYGHMEVYAPSYLLLLVILILFLKYLESKRTSLLAGLVFFWLVGLRLHPVFLLILPPLVLILASQWQQKSTVIAKLLTWKGLATGVILPLALVGAWVYFFVFEDHIDNRVLAGSYDRGRLFLPLWPPEPPLDRYHLFGVHHLFDFGNISLTWSPSSLLILGVIGACYHRLIRWQSLPVLVTGLTLLLFVAFFFMVNPLLSMPLDWDLFSFPAPVLLLFTLVLVRQVQDQKALALKVLLLTIALSIFSITGIAVNASLPAYAHRMESLGIRIFNTYYIWSGKTLEFAIGLGSPDPAEQYKRREKVLSKLKPNREKDTEYARLLAQNGRYHLRTTKDYESALPYFQEALEYAPGEGEHHLGLLESQFRLKNFDAAYQSALALIELNFPGPKKALRMAIHCALEASRSADAYRHSGNYLQTWPEDPVILKVHQGLSENTSPEDLAKLFATPD